MSLALNEVRRIQHTVSLEQVLKGRLRELKDMGVKYTLICGNGTGRSVNAAVFADREMNMPAVAIHGGGYFIESSSYFEQLVIEILAGPMLGIILDAAETRELPKFYNNLKNNAAFVVASYEEAMRNMRG